MTCSTIARGLGRAGRALLSAPIKLGKSFSPTGLAAGAGGFVVSTQPTLIPRTWVEQGVISGVATAAGYAVGTRTEALLRWASKGHYLPEKYRGKAQIVAGAALGAVAVTTLVSGAAAQRRQAKLWGKDPHPPHIERALPLAGVFFAAPVLIMRFAEKNLSAMHSLLGKALPKPVADVGADALYGWIVFTLWRGGVNEVLGRYLTNRYVKRDHTVDDALVPPTEPERSASPDSPESWESLGFEGRKFVSLGPRASEISEFTSRPAKEPIRVYVGMGDDVRKAEDVDIAALAARLVDELDRTGAWERKVLAVVCPTGTGWIDGPAAASLEILHDGDTAIAGFQYSADPSWIQLVLNLRIPDKAGRALFEAVYSRWSRLPQDSRPLLVPFGLSLGSYGSQAPFRSLEDVDARTDGAVWVGTPRFTPLHVSLVDGRDAGSSEVKPVYEGGKVVRWGTGNGGDQHLDDAEGADGLRVAYLMHPSDAVARWWWPAAWSKDDWYSEPAGQDVTSGIRWWPLITGVQLFLDLMSSDNAYTPAGFAHHYCEEYVDAWHWVTRAEGWDDAQLQRLREHMHKVTR